MEEVTATKLTKAIEDYFSPREESGLYDLDIEIVQYAIDRMPGDAGGETHQGDNSESDVHQYLKQNEQDQVKIDASFLVTDSHKQFLQTISNGAQ